LYLNQTAKRLLHVTISRTVHQTRQKISFFLRHDTFYIFNEHGWYEVSDLVANHGFTMDELREIVDLDYKQWSERINRSKTGHEAVARPVS